MVTIDDEADERQRYRRNAVGRFGPATFHSGFRHPLWYDHKGSSFRGPVAIFLVLYFFYLDETTLEYISLFAIIYRPNSSETPLKDRT